jgi:hypothetical protein
MKNFIAVTQLVIRRNRIITQGEDRNLRAREKLAKERERAYSSFKSELAREKEKSNNPFTGGGLLGALGTGAIGAGLLNKVRGGGRGGGSPRGGLRGGKNIKPGNKIVPGPRSKVPGGGRLRGSLRMGKFNAVATTALTGVDYGMRLSEGQTQTQAVSGALSTTAGGLAGMAAGAKGGALLGGTIGAFFGGVGAAPGAAIGGALGGLIGSFTGATLGAGISDKLTGVGQSADSRRQLEIEKDKLSKTTKMRGSNDDYDEAVTKLENLLLGQDSGNDGGIPNFSSDDDLDGEDPEVIDKGPKPDAPPSFQEQLEKVKSKAIPAEVGDYVADLRTQFDESGGQRQSVDTPYGRLIMSPRTGIFDPNKEIPNMRFISNEETALRREYTQKTIDNPLVGGFLTTQDLLNKVPIAGGRGAGRTRLRTRLRTPLRTPSVTPPVRPTTPKVTPPVRPTTPGNNILPTKGLVKPRQKPIEQNGASKIIPLKPRLSELIAGFKNPLPKISGNSGIDLNGLAPLFMLPLLGSLNQQQTVQEEPAEPQEDSSDSVAPASNNKYGMDVFSYLDIIN